MRSLVPCTQVGLWALASFVVSVASAGCASSNVQSDATVHAQPGARASTAPKPSSAASVASDVAHGFVVDLPDGNVTIDGAAVDDDAIRDVLAKKERSEVAIFRAAKDTAWGSIVHLLDLMKQSGNRAFVLTVRDDHARRTPPMELPKAHDWVSPLAQLAIITIDREGNVLVDGAGFNGPLRERIRSVIPPRTPRNHT